MSEKIYDSTGHSVGETDGSTFTPKYGGLPHKMPAFDQDGNPYGLIEGDRHFPRASHTSSDVTFQPLLESCMFLAALIIAVPIFLGVIALAIFSIGLYSAPLWAPFVIYRINTGKIPEKLKAQGFFQFYLFHKNFKIRLTLPTITTIAYIMLIIGICVDVAFILVGIQNATKGIR